jgi:CheY-like chemotaxis protein
MSEPLPSRHVILLTTDLLSLSPLAFAAQSAGGSLEAAASLEQLLVKVGQRRPSVVLIDLTLPGLDIASTISAVRNVAADEAPILVVAYGPHVHEGRLEAARQAGCDRVLSRGQIHRDLANLLRETWAR